MGSNGHTNGHSPNGSGGGLGGQLRPQSTRDTRLLERAVAEQWPIPEECKAEVVTRQVAIATNPKSKTREATSAARCLAMMNGQNLAAYHKALDKVAPDKMDVSHTLGVDTGKRIRDALEHPEYVEYLRQRDLGEDCQPRTVRAAHEPGNGQPLDDGAPPCGD